MVEQKPQNAYLGGRGDDGILILVDHWVRHHLIKMYRSQLQIFKLDLIIRSVFGSSV